VELFEELLQQHEKQLYRVAFRLAGNYEDAQDLVQDTLFEAFRHFDRFEPGTRFDRWLYRIMTNRHIDKVRKHSRMKVVSLDQPPEDGEGTPLAWDIPDESEDPERVCLGDELEEPIQKALDELPPEYRSTIMLVDLEGFSYEEASRVLQCPIGTVRSRLNRGRRLLREKLRPFFGGRMEESTTSG